LAFAFDVVIACFFSLFKKSISSRPFLSIFFCKSLASCEKLDFMMIEY
jgi:hypothetical protein